MMSLAMTELICVQSERKMSTDLDEITITEVESEVDLDLPENSRLEDAVGALVAARLIVHPVSPDPVPFIILTV